jgi:hypothetical protein
MKRLSGPLWAIGLTALLWATHVMPWPVGIADGLGQVAGAWVLVAVVQVALSYLRPSEKNATSRQQ